MSSDNHTPISLNSAGNSNTVNAPLGQLDAAINALRDGGPFNALAFQSPSDLTINSGVITVSDTTVFIKLGSETGTSDTLDTINSTLNNRVLLAKALAGHTITISEFGNITTGTPVALSGERVVMFLYENSVWSVVNVFGGTTFPRGYIAGLEVSVTSNTVVAIADGVCLDDTHTRLLERGVYAASTSGAGIGGLDTGSVASNTWYYVWLCAGGSGVGAVLSTSATSPTLPAGYEVYKRRVGSVKTDGSSNLLRQKMVVGSGCNRQVLYTACDNASPYQILNEVNLGNGTGAATAIDCSAIVPTTSIYVIGRLMLDAASAATAVYWYVNNLSVWLFTATGTGFTGAYEAILELTTAQAASAYGDADDEDFTFVVRGYIDNLLPDLIP